MILECRSVLMAYRATSILASIRAKLIRRGCQSKSADEMQVGVRYRLIRPMIMQIIQQTITVIARQPRRRFVVCIQQHWCVGSPTSAPGLHFNMIGTPGSDVLVNSIIFLLMLFLTRRMWRCRRRIKAHHTVIFFLLGSMNIVFV